MTRLKKIEVDQNSMFLWGDGIFTSFLLKDGKIDFGHAHMKRLEKSLDWLGFHEASYQIEELIQNELRGFKDGEFKVRLSFFFEKKEPCYSLLISPFKALSINSLVTCLSPSKLEDIPNYIKRPHYGLKLQKKRKLELTDDVDCLWHDSEKRVIHSTFNNVIFFSKDQSFLSPVINRGYLKGIALREFELFLLQINKSYSERDIFVDEVKKFQGCFLINSVSGILPILSVDDHLFGHSQNLLDSLMEKWERYKQEKKLTII